MGLFDWFTGKKSESSQQTDMTQTTKASGTASSEAFREQGQASTSAKTGASAQQQQELQTVRTLDPETEAFLKNFMESLSATASGGTSGNLAPEVSELLETGRGLITRAQGADAAFASGNAAILDAARQEGEQKLDQTTTALRTNAGSGMNSAVEQLRMRGANELETNLAGLAGELSMKGRELATDELIASLQPFIAGAELGAGDRGVQLQREMGHLMAIPQLAQILKGATTVGETIASGQAQEKVMENELVSLLEAILEEKEFQQDSTVHTKGTIGQTGSSTGSPLDVFSAFFPKGFQG